MEGYDILEEEYEVNFSLDPKKSKSPVKKAISNKNNLKKSSPVKDLKANNLFSQINKENIYTQQNLEYGPQAGAESKSYSRQPLRMLNIANLDNIQKNQKIPRAFHSGDVQKQKKKVEFKPSVEIIPNHYTNVKKSTYSVTFHPRASIHTQEKDSLENSSSFFNSPLSLVLNKKTNQPPNPPKESLQSHSEKNSMISPLKKNSIRSHSEKKSIAQQDSTHTIGTKVVDPALNNDSTVEIENVPSSITTVNMSSDPLNSSKRKVSHIDPPHEEILSQENKLNFQRNQDTHIEISENEELFDFEIGGYDEEEGFSERSQNSKQIDEDQIEEIHMKNDVNNNHPPVNTLQPIVVEDLSVWKNKSSNVIQSHPHSFNNIDPSTQKSNSQKKNIIQTTNQDLNLENRSIPYKQTNSSHLPQTNKRFTLSKKNITPNTTNQIRDTRTDNHRSRPPQNNNNNPTSSSQNNSINSLQNNHRSLPSGNHINNNNNNNNHSTSFSQNNSVDSSGNNNNLENQINNQVDEIIEPKTIVECNGKNIICYFCFYDYSISEEENNRRWRIFLNRIKSDETWKYYRKSFFEDLPACNVCCKKNHNFSHRYHGELIDWHRTRIQQQNRCGICHQELSQYDNRQVHWDHDHTNGISRGLLCNLCNPDLGMFCNRSLEFISYIQYLSQHNHQITSEMTQVATSLFRLIYEPIQNTTTIRQTNSNNQNNKRKKK